MAGDCGTCTMCCKLLGITELKKPKNKLCEHCSIGVGCKIYHERPESCRAFKCIWLQTQILGRDAFPLSMRPDKSKVVLHLTPDEKNVVAKVDPNYPLAWTKKGISDALAVFSDKFLVLIDNGKRYWVIEKRGVREIRMSVADADGIEHFEGYV